MQNIENKIVDKTAQFAWNLSTKQEFCQTHRTMYKRLASRRHKVIKLQLTWSENSSIFIKHIYKENKKNSD